ncbi:piggyBac transposable element-derived protein 4-like [Leptopilina heterotoma]|uniref:piggyBac transposable element-derived protein 4-like n=1 Tax=Leptopilina heterotoma TaxID=63436 RepID=UPI001CA8FE59|nr:piggyBac transposable element-derived protein 4-like [Leptopilina heterotoma]
MIKFKGRSSMKQYMPLKPIKRGYKCWVRADPSGYVCEFQMYTGKTKSTEKQLGARVVKDLTRELKGNNHHVYFDNFFTGVDLMIYLKKDKIFACGTVRQNRSRLPKSKVQDKQMKHGDSEFRTSNTGIRWVKWMDKKAVYFLSNYHDPRETASVNRKQKDGTLKPTSCPVMAFDYNKHMGYVDKADHLLSTYNIDRKSKKWWHRIFFHFLDVIVVNAYILYKEKRLNPTLTAKEFRLRLVDELVGHKLPSSTGKKRKLSTISSYKPKVSEEKRKSQSAHMPEIIASPRRCAHCSTKADQKRTSWMCKTCNVPLCLHPTRNCFAAYHC